MAAGHWGPIWRSVRRHRAFALAILEVAVGFFVLVSLLITARWYAAHGFPPSGHRETDLVEVVSWGAAAPPAATAEAQDRQRREMAALGALPGVHAVAAVSSTEIDDQFGLPIVLWTDDDGAGVNAAGAAPPPGSAGRVVGWIVDASADLPEVIGLRFLAGRSFSALLPDQQARSVVITRSLAAALFGDPAAAIGRTLRSTRHPAARVAGVVADVRLRSPFLYQSTVTAIYAAPVADERQARYLLRAGDGQGATVRAAAERALVAPARLVHARLFGGPDIRVLQNARGTVAVLLTVALMLGLVAVMGNLAVATFLVSDRRRVISVRRALGATRADVVRHLIVETLIPTQIGCLLGLALTLLLLPAMQARFAELTLRLTDIAATVALLSLGSVAAKILPALRAARIPPSEAGRTL
jgi:putative ABC transport system permease protein